MSELHGFILHAKTRPEKAQAFEALFRAYVEPSRAEPGCIEYHTVSYTHLTLPTKRIV